MVGFKLKYAVTAGLTVFWLAGLIFVLVGLSFFWLYSHHEACWHICTYTNKLHRLQAFEQQVLTTERFWAIRYGFIAIGLLYGGFSIILLKKLSDWVFAIAGAIVWLQRGIAAKYNLLTPLEKRMAWGISVTLTVYGTYQASILPIFYDEAWTFLNFSLKSPLVTVSYYPAPNNHVFFSLLTNASHLLPLPEPLGLRLPNLILLPIMFWLALLILRNWFAGHWALLGALLFVVSYPVQLYSVQARGYLLYMMLGALAFYAVYQLAERHKPDRYYGVFSLICILGLYTIPSFLYVIFSCSVFFVASVALSRSWDKLRPFVLSGASIIVGTLLLYAPVFIVSGWQSVFNNSYVQRQTWATIAAQMHTHLIQTSNWLIAYLPAYGWLALVLLLVSLVVAYITKPPHHTLILLCVVFLVCPVAIMLLHRTVPFERTWSYTMFPTVVGALALFSRIRMKPLVIYIFGSVCFMTALRAFPDVYRRQYAMDFDAKDIATAALQDRAKVFYIEKDYYEVLLFYYYTLWQQPYQVDNRQTGKNFKAQKKYDYLLIENANPNVAQQYQRKDIGRFINVFAKKK